MILCGSPTQNFSTFFVTNKCYNLSPDISYLLYFGRELNALLQLLTKKKEIIFVLTWNFYVFSGLRRTYRDHGDPYYENHRISNLLTGYSPWSFRFWRSFHKYHSRTKRNGSIRGFNHVEKSENLEKTEKHWEFLGKPRNTLFVLLFKSNLLTLNWKTIWSLVNSYLLKFGEKMRKKTLDETAGRN